MNSQYAPLVIEGVGEIADRYDGIILDLWGVVHNGVEALPGAVDAMRRLHAANKRIALLSNAPRRAAAVADRLTEMNIAPNKYDAVMSSGEEVWCHLSERTDPWYRTLGRRCLHIGAERDKGMFDGLDLLVTGEPTDAEFVLNTGTYDDGDSVAAYDRLLEDLQLRGLPMICANPDLVVMRADERQICAGALAERYESLGGSVRWHGKPDPSVYLACLAKLELTNRSRVLAVGDSFRTDICGANRTGLDSLFIAGGIHAADLCAAGGAPDLTRVTQSAAAASARPDFVSAAFAW